MPHDRDVQVHLLPDLAPPGRLSRGLAVVIDVLRSTTTMIHALASGCIAVRPCLEVEEARQLAGQMRAGRVLLGGERGGLACPGFDLGNSPTEYTAKACCGTTVVLTTTNGTRACYRAAEAERVLIAGFVNYSGLRATSTGRTAGPSDLRGNRRRSLVGGHLARGRVRGLSL